MDCKKASKGSCAALLPSNIYAMDGSRYKYLTLCRLLYSLHHSISLVVDRKGEQDDGCALLPFLHQGLCRPMHVRSEHPKKSLIIFSLCLFSCFHQNFHHGALCRFPLRCIVYRRNCMARSLHQRYLGMFKQRHGCQASWT
jgi:hypothetical protein